MKTGLSCSTRTLGKHPQWVEAINPPGHGLMTPKVPLESGRTRQSFQSRKPCLWPMHWPGKGLRLLRPLALLADSSLKAGRLIGSGYNEMNSYHNIFVGCGKRQYISFQASQKTVIHDISTLDSPSLNDKKRRDN